MPIHRHSCHLASAANLPTAEYGFNPDFAIGKCVVDAPACRAQTAAAQARGGPKTIVKKIVHVHSGAVHVLVHEDGNANEDVNVYEYEYVKNDAKTSLRFAAIVKIVLLRLCLSNIQVAPYSAQTELHLEGKICLKK